MPVYVYTGPINESVSFPGDITLSPSNPRVTTTLILEGYDSFDPNKVQRIQDDPYLDIVVYSDRIDLSTVTVPYEVPGLEKSTYIQVIPFKPVSVYINSTALKPIKTAGTVVLQFNEHFVERLYIEPLETGSPYIVEVHAYNLFNDISIRS